MPRQDRTRYDEAGVFRRSVAHELLAAFAGQMADSQLVVPSLGAGAVALSSLGACGALDPRQQGKAAAEPSPFVTGPVSQGHARTELDDPWGPTAQSESWVKRAFGA